MFIDTLDAIEIDKDEVIQHLQFIIESDVSGLTINKNNYSIEQRSINTNINFDIIEISVDNSLFITNNQPDEYETVYDYVEYILELVFMATNMSKISEINGWSKVEPEKDNILFTFEGFDGECISLEKRLDEYFILVNGEPITTIYNKSMESELFSPNYILDTNTQLNKEINNIFRFVDVLHNLDPATHLENILMSEEMGEEIQQVTGVSEDTAEEYASKHIDELILHEDTINTYHNIGHNKQNKINTYIEENDVIRDVEGRVKKYMVNEGIYESEDVLINFI